VVELRTDAFSSYSFRFGDTQSGCRVGRCGLDGVNVAAALGAGAGTRKVDVSRARRRRRDAGARGQGYASHVKAKTGTNRVCWDWVERGNLVCGLALVTFPEQIDVQAPKSMAVVSPPKTMVFEELLDGCRVQDGLSAC